MSDYDENEYGGKKTRVLLVDDAQFVRYTLRLLLESNGYEIVGEAENGQDAIKKYKELTPDITLMDITMPVMGGIESVKAITENDPNAKVIMVSAMGNEGTVKDAILAGAKTFIVKPFNENTVLTVLAKMCKKD